MLVAVQDGPCVPPHQQVPQPMGTLRAATAVPCAKRGARVSAWSAPMAPRAFFPSLSTCVSAREGGRDDRRGDCVWRPDGSEWGKPSVRAQSVKGKRCSVGSARNARTGTPQVLASRQCRTVLFLNRIPSTYDTVVYTGWSSL